MKNVRNYLFIRKKNKKIMRKYLRNHQNKKINKKSKSVELFNSIFDENLCQNPKQDKQKKNHNKKTDNLSLTFAKYKKKNSKNKNGKFFMIGPLYKQFLSITTLQLDSNTYLKTKKKTKNNQMEKRKILKLI